MAAWKPYVYEYLVDILNGEYPVDEAAEDLASFRNSKYYTGTRAIYTPSKPKEGGK